MTCREGAVQKQVGAMLGVAPKHVCRQVQHGNRNGDTDGRSHHRLCHVPSHGRLTP